MVCIPSTATNVIKAVSEVEKNSDKKITIFSFGDVPGCENILKLVENVDELKSPKAVEFNEEEMKQDCAIVFWSSGTTGMKIF